MEDTVEAESMIHASKGNAMDRSIAKTNKEKKKRTMIGEL